MSSYCINPLCEARENPDDAENCLACGTSLMLNERFRLVKPLRELIQNVFTYNEVFEVDDAGNKWEEPRRRVMKILKWNDPQLVKMIERESMALRRIRHPCVPYSTVDDFFIFEPSDSPFTLRCLVMDKFEGLDLAQWLGLNDKISQSTAVDWLKQLVEILDLVHHTEFFHRDIKPSNIILQPSGKLALVDFGTARRITDTYLAKISASGGTSTRVGNYEITSVVTPGYTPLEQIHGKAVPQSDFYALGRTMVTLVTGLPLIRLSEDRETGKLNWRKYAPQIDKPFADLLNELMASSAVGRPPTTEIILKKLESLPLKTKIYRVIKSPLFKVSASILFISTLSVLGYLSLPLVANHYLELGKKAQKENRLAEAENQFKLAINLQPNASKLVSQYYLEQADRRNIPLEDSKKYYELAIRYNPKNEVSYNNLALVCQQLRDIACVEKSYQMLFKLKPNSWTGHYGLGSFYDDNGEYKLAIEQYQLAIKSSEEAVYAISNLARLQVIEGKYDKAIALVLRGLKKTQETELQAALYKTWGWAELEQKNYAQAKKYLEKSGQLYPRTDTYCLLAQVQEKNNAAQDARLSWEACLLAQSSLPEVQQWRQQFLDRALGKVVPKSSP